VGSAVPPLRPTVRKHLVSMSAPRPSFLAPLLICNPSQQQPHKHAMSSEQDLEVLQKAFNEEPWLRNHSLEPVVGHRLCPPGAEVHGIRGLSCYTAFVKESEIKEGKWECRFEACRGLLVTSREDAIRHMRYHHFDHRPFACTQWLVHVTVSQPPIDTLPLLDCTVPVGSTPRLTWKPTSSTAHNGPPPQNMLCPHCKYLSLLFVVSTKPLL